MHMRACFIGDSLTHGVGDAEALGWSGRLIQRMVRQNPEMTAYDLGVRHETSSQIQHRWEAEARVRLAAGMQHRLAFCFGTNDGADDGTGAPRVAQADSLANVRKILTTACAMAPTVMIGPPPLRSDPAADARIAELEAAQQKIAAEFRVPYLPVFNALSHSKAWTDSAAAGDGTHPDAAGYAVLADLIWNWPAFQAWLKP